MLLAMVDMDVGSGSGDPVKKSIILVTMFNIIILRKAIYLSIYFLLLQAHLSPISPSLAIMSICFVLKGCPHTRSIQEIGRDCICIILITSVGIVGFVNCGK